MNKDQKNAELARMVMTMLMPAKKAISELRKINLEWYCAGDS